jgi:hypothetical protein
MSKQPVSPITIRLMTIGPGKAVNNPFLTRSKQSQAPK